MYSRDLTVTLSDFYSIDSYHTHTHAQWRESTHSRKPVIWPLNCKRPYTYFSSCASFKSRLFVCDVSKLLRSFACAILKEKILFTAKKICCSQLSHAQAEFRQIWGNSIFMVVGARKMPDLIITWRLMVLKILRVVVVICTRFVSNSSPVDVCNSFYL